MPTVIARDAQGRYAFFRSTQSYGGAAQEEDQSIEDILGNGKSVDFKKNLQLQQKVIIKENRINYDTFRRKKGKGVEVNKAMKK
jgi:hypothetical protein